MSADRVGGEASSILARQGATTPTNALPTRPIEGRLPVWIPKAATIGCMGLAYWLSTRNEGLRGVHALVFPFFGNDARNRLQGSYLVSNLISPVLIWTVEGHRRGGSSMATLALQSLAGAAVQISGIERIAPIYYLFSMTTGDSLSSPEGQAVPSEVAKAILPATILGYVVPTALISLVPLTATGVSLSIFNIQSAVAYAFFLAPVSVPFLTTLISSMIRYYHPKLDPGSRSNKPTSEMGRTSGKQDSNRRLSSLRTAYVVSSVIQAAQHIYTVTCNFKKTPKSQRRLTAVLSGLLTYPIVPGQKYSTLALYAGATLGFGLYTIWDLRRRGMITNTDTKKAAVGAITGQVLFGPGATYAGLWWWREGVLARVATSSGNST
ncbi:hypothetical protein N8I77_007026 [Diaporthe amygdali]|uniref:Uncharacterized protein n=1 Tax=Phomopsis amygdali TaxID=1214568 RepID=A0AAD9SB75_PHOAM|nr:hypothetical protein N8I77_007026 [Diaporthe amygdali]